MATDIDQQVQVGIRGPSSIPILYSSTHHHPIPVAPRQNYHQNHDPSYLQNQLQFNMGKPYSINSLAANFTKPCPLVIEKVPPLPPQHVPPTPMTVSVPSSPASSISSSRLHLAVQLAKMDAKRIKEDREQWRQKHVSPAQAKGQSLAAKVTQGHSVRKIQDVRRQASIHNDKVYQSRAAVQNKSKRERDCRRSLHGYHVYPDHLDENSPDHSVDKQTKEIRRLEKQIHQYLQKLDELINKGQEVIQKKDKRLHKKDDVSNLSDEDTDPRQFERADEQATRSARVLYMIERQIRELDDELRKKGKNAHGKRNKKSQTLSRLAAAQRATVRALQMLINSAPLQPKGSHHYPQMYQELTSLIQQLSLLSIQLENDSDVLFDRRAQVGNRDDLLKRPAQNRRTVSKEPDVPVRHVQSENGLEKRSAFKQESTTNTKQPLLRDISPVRRTGPDEDSALTIDPTPERSATLRAGLEALLRVKQQQKTARPTVVTSGPITTKKKGVLLPSSLQAKRRRANLAVQKTIKPPVDSAHFTKETTASRLKRVDKQHRAPRKDDVKEEIKKDLGVKNIESKSPEATSEVHKVTRFHEELQEKEIQRQMWLENESKRKLREVMEIPQQLVSEAEEAIKIKLKPLLDQAQVVVETGKTKPIQERFVDLASKVTMKENEALSEMILDDLLIDTAEEFQRLNESDDVESQVGDLRDSSTLENILQKLEQFEKEEENIRRRLTHVSYDDPRERRLPQLQEENIKIKPIHIGAKEPHPIVIQSSTSQSKKPVPTRQVPKFASMKADSTGARDAPFDVRPAMTNDVRLTMTKDVIPAMTNDRPTTYPRIPFVEPSNSVHLSLSSKSREDIYSYRQKYTAYLKGTNSHAHGTFNPWKVVETLSDDIFDEILKEVADEFCGACDDVTELVFQSEFMKE